MLTTLSGESEKSVQPLLSDGVGCLTARHREPHAVSRGRGIFAGAAPNAVERSRSGTVGAPGGWEVSLLALAHL